jgi:hypothetical protein
LTNPNQPNPNHFQVGTYVTEESWRPRADAFLEKKELKQQAKAQAAAMRKADLVTA